MSILNWAEIELKHGKSNLSDVQWGRKVIQSIDTDDYITLSQLMNKTLHPNYDINIQTNIRGYAGYLWTISIHQFLGDTALHFALRQKKLYCVYMLIYLEADPNILNNAGERPIDMLQGIYNMTYENMKFDAKRQLIKKTHPKQLVHLPKEFLHPANSVSIEREAWNLMHQGCLLYTKLPKHMQRPSDSINTSHAAPKIRRHLSFNLKTALKDWKESVNSDGEKFYYNELTGESSYGPPAGWNFEMPPINPLKIRPHEPFIPRPEPPPPLLTIDDVWTKGDVRDIAQLLERQKQRYYRKKLPSTQFHAQGLSLLSSVKLSTQSTLPAVPGPNTTSTTSTTAPSKAPTTATSAEHIAEQNIPLPAATLLSASSKTAFATTFQQDPNLHPTTTTTTTITPTTTTVSSSSAPPSSGDALLQIPQHLLESKGVETLQTAWEKGGAGTGTGTGDLQQLEQQLMQGKGVGGVGGAGGAGEGKEEGGSGGHRHLPNGFQVTKSDKQLLQLPTTTTTTSSNTTSNTGNAPYTTTDTNPNLFAFQQYRDIHILSRHTNLKYMQLGNRGAQIISPALTDDPLLRYVNLSQARIGHPGCLYLAPAIQSMHRLRCLDLSGNVLTSDSGEVLAQTVLRTPSALQILSLAGNRLGWQGVLSIITALLRQQRLLDNVTTTSPTITTTPHSHHRKGIRWCSVKNNQLQSADYEALGKLLGEEEDYEVKKVYTRSTNNNRGERKDNRREDKGGIYCRRRPLPSSSTVVMYSSGSSNNNNGNGNGNNRGEGGGSKVMKYPAASTERDFTELPTTNITTTSSSSVSPSLLFPSSQPPLVIRETVYHTPTTGAGTGGEEKVDDDEEIEEKKAEERGGGGEREESAALQVATVVSILRPSASLDSLSSTDSASQPPLPPSGSKTTTKRVAFSGMSTASLDSLVSATSVAASATTSGEGSKRNRRSGSGRSSSSGRSSRKNVGEGGDSGSSSGSEEEGEEGANWVVGGRLEEEINQWLTSSSSSSSEGEGEGDGQEDGGRQERRRNRRSRGYPNNAGAGGGESTGQWSDVSEETRLRKRWKQKYLLTIVI